jgi:hypothetical protein
MAREFNITGVCVPHLHYMVDISKKTGNIIELIKIWRGLEYHTEGIARLKNYMHRESAQKSYMLIMDKTRYKEFTSYLEAGILMVWI